MPYAANDLELMARPRITLTVSEDIYEYLSDWADREERPLANLAAFLLSQAVRERQKTDLPRPASPRKGTSSSTKPSSGKGKGGKAGDS
jgi:hypothetical protein